MTNIFDDWPPEKQSNGKNWSKAKLSAMKQECNYQAGVLIELLAAPVTIYRFFGIVWVE